MKMMFGRSAAVGAAAATPTSRNAAAATRNAMLRPWSRTVGT